MAVYWVWQHKNGHRMTGTSFYSGGSGSCFGLFFFRSPRISVFISECFRFPATVFNHQAEVRRATQVGRWLLVCDHHNQWLEWVPYSNKQPRRLFTLLTQEVNKRKNMSILSISYPWFITCTWHLTPPVNECDSCLCTFLVC